MAGFVFGSCATEGAGKTLLLMIRAAPKLPHPLGFGSAGNRARPRSSGRIRSDVCGIRSWSLHTASLLGLVPHPSPADLRFRNGASLIPVEQLHVGTDIRGGGK
jgi:hypothetical protein